MTWRDVLPIHPAAELFPLMSESELRELGEDIKQHGLRQPCRFIEDEDGRPVLLDGRNRLDALVLLGEEITLDNSVIFDRFLPNDIGLDPYAYVISANIHRRHLTAEQRQELLIKLIARDPGRSNRQIAKEVGVPRKAVDRARAKGEDVGQVAHVSRRVDSTGRSQPSRAKQKTKSMMQAEAMLESSERGLAEFKTACDRCLPKLTPRDLETANRYSQEVCRKLRSRVDRTTGSLFDLPFEKAAP